MGTETKRGLDLKKSNKKMGRRKEIYCRDPRRGPMTGSTFKKGATKRS